MAGLRKDHSWLENELAGQLGMVAAPDSLWRAIHEQRRPLRVRAGFWMNWTKWPIAAAALLLATLVWRFGEPRDPSTVLEALAGRELRELADGSGNMDLRSSDPREIRAWVRARSDINVRLPDRASGDPAIQLIGARMAQVNKHPVAVITYRVDDDFAAMLVAGTESNGPRHASPRIQSTKEMSLYSWNLGSDEYTIAFGSAQESQRACLLCHVVPPAVLVNR